ncbi:hypothetical protein [Pseudomonas sp. AU12215]|uniref:hypothetical protein n=1 Tax=Pseudomonas sp. AU12215 TaxID=1860123 RepID=UPI0007EE4F99|nr:hypothetical protein [Pseudomonas sp. AU12215]OBY58220.1 hypothetical protein A9513_012005 [Pseudomonas sp. AU12215]
MGDIDVDGSKNRVAGRDYIEVNLPGKDVEEPITQQQRSMLRQLVEEISAESGTDARILWREVVHARVGVEHVGEIPRSRFLEAQDALVSWLDGHRTKANVRMLVDRIRAITDAKEIESQRDTWCLRQFGEKHLNAMGTEHLRQVLAYVEDFQALQPAVAEANEPRKLGFITDVRGFMAAYPVHSGAIALVLFILGRIS